MVDFLRWRAATALFSAVLIGFFVILCVYQFSTRGHVFSYGIDFTGGVQVLFRFDQPVGDDQIKSVLTQNGWGGASVRTFANNELMVRVKEFENDSKGLGERIRSVLSESFPQNKIVVLESESVGPGVGAVLRLKSIYAIIVALCALLLYIALRFWSWAFAVGAVVALAHDALVMLAIFLLFDREISINVIAAILAILGYSINDTIVIFSQIRDDFKKKTTESLEVVVNGSLNKTLKRTILTSISTAIPVLTMFLLGGEALFDISLALLVGIVFGTYSSIYIASPIMMLIRKSKSASV